MFRQLTLAEYAVAKLAYTPPLFALPTYLAQVKGDIHLFSILDEEARLEGVIAFLMREGTAISPPRATFGGWYGNTLPTKVQADFWLWVQKELKLLGAKSIQIKLPPAYIEGQMNFGAYTTMIQDLNFHLILSEDFVKNLHLSAHRRLKKAQKAGFTATHWENLNLDTAYQFIAEARKRKGYPLTLTCEQFQEMFALFPANYAIFIVKSPTDEIAALTVTVKINAQVLYNFYPADAEKYLTYSPMIFLLEYLHTWAGRQGFEVLDLGIATENGVQNEGLIRFKEHLGAIKSLKNTLMYVCS